MQPEVGHVCQVKITLTHIMNARPSLILQQNIEEASGLVLNMLIVTEGGADEKNISAHF